MRHTFEAEQWLPYPIEVVFAFFANPENLPRLMPGWQKARIEEATFAPPPPRPTGVPVVRGVFAGQGTRMTISFRPFPFSPIRVPWDAEIDQFVWNDHFCDTQLRGPFAFWHHCHRVSSETRKGVAGTLLRIQATSPFLLHWTTDEWQHSTDTRPETTGIGIQFVDIPSPEQQKAPIRFTFLWVENNRWEGKDYVVEVKQRPSSYP